MKEIRDGFELELREDGTIIKITYTEGRTIRLGQRVTSNGAHGIPKGRRGIVVGLCRPGLNNRTSNVIDVIWDGATFSIGVKFKELMW